MREGSGEICSRRKGREGREERKGREEREGREGREKTEGRERGREGKGGRLVQRKVTGERNREGEVVEEKNGMRQRESVER